MKFIDLFAGIGGFRRGMELAGHKCIGFCEWDKYAAASYISMHLLTEGQREKLPAFNLKKRQKEILKNEYRNGEWYSDDIRNVDAGSVPKCDCWCFGAPCQDFSIAGKRAGLDGDRSSLIREIFRILGEIREEDRPEWLIYENVKGMLSSNRGFDYLAILLAMDELGYDIEWQLFNSKDWGVPQNRERVYTVGHLRRCGTRKIFPITGADGENNISVIANGKFGHEQNGRIYDIGGIAPGLNGIGNGGNHEPKIALKINKLGSTRPNRNSSGDVIGVDGIIGTITSRDGKEPKQIGIPVYGGVCNRNGETSGVAVPINKDILLPGNNYNQRKVVHPPDGISRTLISSGHSGNEPKVAIPVLTPDRANKRQNGRRFKENGEPMFTLTAQDRHGIGVSVYDMYSHTVKENGICGTLTANGNTSTTHCGSFGVMYPVIADKTEKGIYVQLHEELTVYAIWHEKYQCYIAIRKLTPKECFRLQGWEDIYFERAAFVNSDSQLYKQAGNGVTVNVVYAIGKAIAELEGT